MAMLLRCGLVDEAGLEDVPDRRGQGPNTSGQAMQEFDTGRFRVHLIDEACYTPASPDNVNTYDHEYTGPGDDLQSVVGVRCGHHSAILLSTGIRGGVDARSLVYVDETIFVACGSSVFALVLPTLGLQWMVNVDFASCFGLYLCRPEGCLICHGECNITRLTLDGQVVWSTSGRDIFTGAFSVLGDHIRAVDFNGDAYVVDLATGQMRRAC
jgi:hypothetical protein